MNAYTPVDGTVIGQYMNGCTAANRGDLVVRDGKLVWTAACGDPVTFAEIDYILQNP